MAGFALGLKTENVGNAHKSRLFQVLTEPDNPYILKTNLNLNGALTLEHTLICTVNDISILCTLGGQNMGGYFVMESSTDWKSAGSIVLSYDIGMNPYVVLLSRPQCGTLTHLWCFSIPSKNRRLCMRRNTMVYTPPFFNFLFSQFQKRKDNIYGTNRMGGPIS